MTSQIRDQKSSGKFLISSEMSLVVMRKRAIDDFGTFRPVPRIQKRSKCFHSFIFFRMANASRRFLKLHASRKNQITSILLSFDLRKSEVEERGKRAIIWARSRVTENPFATLFFELASCNLGLLNFKWQNRR